MQLFARIGLGAGIASEVGGATNHTREKGRRKNCKEEDRPKVGMAGKCGFWAIHVYDCRRQLQHGKNYELLALLSQGWPLGIVPPLSRQDHVHRLTSKRASSFAARPCQYRSFNSRHSVFISQHDPACTEVRQRTTIVFESREGRKRVPPAIAAASGMLSSCGS